MSSRILRRAVLEEAPLVIDNTYEVPYDAADAAVLLDDDLVEALQYEHPDAEPDEIEDVLQEVMDQLREGSGSEFRVADSAAAPEIDAPEEDDFFFGDDEASGESESLIPELEEAAQLDVAQDGSSSPAATEVIEDARREAQRILAEADERAAEIEKAAYDKGYQEGVEAGRADGDARAAEMVQQAVAIVDKATELHDSMLHEAEAEMAALCLEVARKVIHSELATNPGVVNGIVEDAVKRINGSPRVTIKVNPDQVESVRAHWDAAFGPDYREKEWVIEGDAGVEPGGCVLDTRYGSIDARIGTQFEQIQKTFALLLGTA